MILETNALSSTIAPLVPILHIPHASRFIPEDIRKLLLLSDKELEQELLFMTDHFTDELFDSSPFPAVRIVFPVSRFVVDPERFVCDNDEPMASKGMGVVYTRTSNGQVLRSIPSEQEKAHLITTYYEPHHWRLSRAVADALEVYKHCLIIDCHSFPSKPLPYEFDQSPVRPDICIGTDTFHTPTWLVDFVVSCFRKAGFNTEIDKPFSGTIVPRPYYRKIEDVRSIMIEINRSLYMDEQLGTHGRQFEMARNRLQSVLKLLVHAEQNNVTA